MPRYRWESIRHAFTRAAMLTLTAVLGGLGVSCASSGARSDVEPAEVSSPALIEVVPRAVEAVATPSVAAPGASLAMPLVPRESTVEGADGLWHPRDVPTLSVGVGGEPVPSRVIGIVSSRVAAIDSVEDVSTWLPPAVPRGFVALDEVSDSGGIERRLLPAAFEKSDTSELSIAWFLIADIPTESDGAEGTRLAIDGRATSIVIESQSVTPSKLTASESASRIPTLAAEAIDSDVLTSEALAGLSSRLAPLAADPLRQWRLRLIELARPELGLGSGTDTSRATDPAAVISRVSTDRWLTALLRLAAADETVARTVLHRLTTIVTLPSGELVPAWQPDAAEDADLLRVLLLPDSTPRRIVDRAETWLRDQPPVALWVIDDAGTAYNPGKPRRTEGPIEPGFDPAESDFAFVRPAPSRAIRNMTVAVSNLRARTSWVSLSSMGLSGSVGVPLRPNESAERTIDAASLAEQRTASIEARVGERAVEQRTPARPVPASPPGPRLGPLAEPHTMATWRSSLSALPPRDRRTAAMLFPESEDPTDATGVRWTLYIEALTPDATGVSGEATDRIAVHLGRYDGAGDSGTIKLNRPVAGGSQTAGESIGGSTWVSSYDGRRWRVWLTLGPRFTQDGWLLLGITRTDDRGVVTAWPRPLMPGETSPGRRRIDLTAWAEPVDIIGDDREALLTP